MGTESITQALPCLSCTVWGRLLNPRATGVRGGPARLGSQLGPGHSSCRQPLTGHLTAGDRVISDAASKPQGCPGPLPQPWDAG